MTTQPQPPHFATYRLEIVRRERLVIYWNDTRRWIEIEIARDILGNTSFPFVALIDRQAVVDRLFEDVLLAFGDTVEEALAKAFATIGGRAEVVEGVRIEEGLAREPRREIPPPDERPDVPRR